MLSNRLSFLRLRIGAGTLALAIVFASLTNASGTDVETKYVEHVRSLVQEGKLRDAMLVCEQLLKWKRDSAEGFLLRGRILALANQPDAAMKDYTRAIQLDSRNAEAYRGRATLYRLQKRQKEALADYDSLIALEPSNAAALRLRAFYKAEIGDDAGALADFRAAVRANPGSGAAYAALAKATKAVGEKTDDTVSPNMVVTPEAKKAVSASLQSAKIDEARSPDALLQATLAPNTVVASKAAVKQPREATPAQPAKQVANESGVKTEAQATSAAPISVDTTSSLAAAATPATANPTQPKASATASEPVQMAALPRGIGESFFGRSHVESAAYQSNSQKAAADLYAKALKEIEHEEYSFALRDLSNAIIANPKYAQALQARAEIKKTLGDNIGFEEDSRRAAALRGIDK